MKQPAARLFAELSKFENENFIKKWPLKLSPLSQMFDFCIISNSDITICCFRSQRHLVSMYGPLEIVNELKQKSNGRTF